MRPGETAKGAELARSVCRNDHAHPLGARVAFCRVAGVQLIGAPDILDVGIVANGIAHWVDQVAGAAEGRADTHVLQTRKYIVNNRLLGHLGAFSIRAVGWGAKSPLRAARSSVRGYPTHVEGHSGGALVSEVPLGRHPQGLRLGDRAPRRAAASDQAHHERRLRAVPRPPAWGRSAPTVRSLQGVEHRHRERNSTPSKQGQ
jgi:hypothetical protein